MVAKPHSIRVATVRLLGELNDPVLAGTDTHSLHQATCPQLAATHARTSSARYRRCRPSFRHQALPSATPVVQRAHGDTQEVRRLRHRPKPVPRQVHLLHLKLPSVCGRALAPTCALARSYSRRQRWASRTAPITTWT